jgi:glutamyl-tRNA(Gln) amidotransferase subunit D
MQKKGSLNEKSLVGKKVRILAADAGYEGTLIFSYDPKTVLLKLASGYNIGIEKGKIKEIIELKEQEKKAELKITRKEKTGLPEISFIVTGGTISSRVDYKTGAVKPLTEPDEIIAVAPKINEIAKPLIESPFMVFSENIAGEHMKKLALAVEKNLNKPNIRGIVVLLGTDTLHYIASALAFMLPNLNKPVILTCSQRSIDRGSSDALLNLTCSSYAALSDIAEVMIVSHATSNDDYCFALRAAKARKMHSSRRDTFRPINAKPLASIWEDGKIEIYQDYNKRNENKVRAELFFEEKTALIKFYPNASSDIIDFFIKEKYRGIVIEATGFGHVALEGKHSWLDSIKKAIKQGIVVCFAPQTLYGRLDPLVYETGRILKDAGVLYLEDMLPETAYIKLAWLLGREKDKEKVKQLMIQNIAHEFNPILSEKDFLI